MTSANDLSERDCHMRVNVTVSHGARALEIESVKKRLCFRENTYVRQST
jgi:hypothetical protein